MAAPITLAELKLHTRVDGDTEDAVMTGYLEAATASVGEYLNSPTPLDDTAPAPVKSAILLQAAGLYLQREDVSDRQMYLSETYYRLLNPYRAMSL